MVAGALFSLLAGEPESVHGEQVAATSGVDELFTGTLRFPSDVLAELWTPAQFEAGARYVRAEDLEASVRISADPQRHLAWLQQDAALALGEQHLTVPGLHAQELHQADYVTHPLPRSFRPEPHG
jgi:hypothetical protein